MTELEAARYYSMKANSLCIEIDVLNWVTTRLGHEHATSQERAARHLEEALELAQAEGIDVAMARRTLEHVYSRPIGDRLKEGAGTAVAMLGWCAAYGLRLTDLAAKELERIEALPDEAIRASLERKAAAGLLTCDGKYPNI